MANPVLSLTMSRYFIFIAALFGFAAVALGAFGAHGLNPLLESFEEAPKHLGWFSTASEYHLTHSIALLAIALAVSLKPEVFDRAPVRVAFVSMALGALVFSGSLYTLAVTGTRWFGAVTPIGGVLMLVGWGALGVFGLSVARGMTGDAPG